MKWQLLTVGIMAGVMALGLCACGSEGNPNGMAYADQPGGTIAVKPQTIGMVTYRPYAKAAPFEDMKAGTSTGPDVTAAPPPAR